MKTLILGTCYIDPINGAQRYGGEMVRLWLDVVAKLNPGADVLIVDSFSPVDLAAILGSPRDDINGVVHVMADNIGHLNTSGRDGWGRSFSWGVEYAIAEHYDYLAYMDCDIIFARPVEPIISRMFYAGVLAACPMDPLYQILENGLMFLDVNYLQQTDFVGRYDWENRKRSADPMEIPERVFETLLGDALFTLPLRGLRDDCNQVTVNNIEHLFPYGLDYLTHVRDFAVYRKFLTMKGIEL